MRFFDAAATREALPFDRLVPALRTVFTSGCDARPRQVHEIVSPGGGRLTSLIMPAWLAGRYYGIKIINIAPGNAARGLPGLHASYLLHDAITGVPLALINGNELTTRRTAAASAPAASWLEGPDARHLLVVGAGKVARLLLDAYRAVRSFVRSIACRSGRALPNRQRPSPASFEPGTSLPWRYLISRRRSAMPTSSVARRWP